MHLIKWVLTGSAAFIVTLFGMALAIGAMIFAIAVKLLTVFTFIVAALTVMFKEKMDERSNQDK